MLSRGGEVVAHEILEDDADVARAARRGRSRAGRGRRAGCGLRPGRRAAPAASPAWSCRRRSRRPAPALRRRLQREVEMAHRPALGAGIAEADVLEHEALRGSAAGTAARFGRRQDLRPHLEEREQVVEVERLPRDLREADQQALQQAAQARGTSRRGRSGRRSRNRRAPCARRCRHRRRSSRACRARRTALPQIARRSASRRLAA